jgi:uncharacterized protein YxjI
MEIKINCGCGTKYKFDVEPVNGRMPVAAVCPNCGASGITDANIQIAQKLGSSTPSYSPPPAATPQPPPVPPTGSAIRLVREVAAAPAPAGTQGRRGNSLLDRHTFFVKEHVGILKLTDTFDILDPQTNEQIGVAREEPPVWAKWLRLVVNKQMMPTVVNIYETEGTPPVASIKRGFALLRSKIRVVAGDGRSLGYFKSKLFSIGGGFHVYDHADQKVAEVKGNWKGWDFTFLDANGREIGKVTKKWAGLGKELFTSADNYMISLSNGGSNADHAALLLAAGLAVDVVYKETE